MDAVAVDQLPLMKKANCNFLAFGVEAGTEKVLDRLHKKQTLKQVEHAVSEAKRHGIDRVHGFFVISSSRRDREGHHGELPFCRPAEAGHLRLQPLMRLPEQLPYGRNTLTAASLTTTAIGPNGSSARTSTPPPCPSAAVNRVRMKGYALLFAHRIFWRPIRTYKLLRLFGKHMKRSDNLQNALEPFSTADLEPEARTMSLAKRKTVAPVPISLGPLQGFRDAKQMERLGQGVKWQVTWNFSIQRHELVINPQFSLDSPLPGSAGLGSIGHRSTGPIRRRSGMPEICKVIALFTTIITHERPPMPFVDWCPRLPHNFG